MAATSKNPFEKVRSQKEELESQVHPPPKRTRKARGAKEAKEKAETDKAAAIILAALILVFGLAALITWLALRPVHSPKYYIDDVHINSFALSNGTATSPAATLNASMAFTVTAVNKNSKMGFTYDWITVDASYGGQNFGRASIGKFRQGKKTNTTITTQFNVQNVTLPEETTTSLAAAIQNGTVPLRAYAKAKIHVKIGKYVSFPLNVDVDCKLVVVPPSATSVAQVVSKVCRLTRPPYKKARKFKSFKPSH